MKPICFGLLAALLLSATYRAADASLDQLIWKRQAEEESASPAPPAGQQNQPASSDNNQNQAARLYPDLPRQPTNFVPPFNGQPNIGSNFPTRNGPTPFVPFGLQIRPPPNTLNADQQPAPFGRVLPIPKQTTAAERLQSQSFADGLGRRLLSMVGIDTSDKLKEGEAEGSQNNSSSPAAPSIDKAAQALQNATVLQQLNKGVNSVYGSLSKMYNSTVQDQINLLQERYRSLTQNNSNPWAERMAQQVPQFFKQMAMKLGDAQEQLNRAWRDLGNGTLMASRSANAQQDQSRSWFGGNGGLPFVDDVDRMFQQGGFFNQMGRSMGFGNEDQSQQQQQPGQVRDLTAQMREFWHNHIEPQVGMVRNQLARVWRDLTASGAMTPETLVRSRTSNNNLGASSSPSNGNLIDNLIKEVEMTASNEYALVEPKNDNAPAESSEATEQQNKTAANPKLSLQMQNTLIKVQRDLNQLWMGLTNSIQSSLNNAKNMLSPRPRFATLDAMASNQQQQSADPAQSELNGKINDLSKLQRDADLVYDAVQQQQREQQRQAFGDRFKNFFNNIDLSAVEQFPNRLGDTVSRFGNVVGDLWHQIPERFDNFMSNIRPTPAPELNPRLLSSTTSAKPNSK